MPKPNHCPVCDAATVDFMRIEFDNKDHDRITAHGYCHSCKSHFVEWHKTAYIGSVREEYEPYAGPSGAPVTCGTLEDSKKSKEPDPKMSMFEKIVNEALDAAEAVSEDLRKRKHK